MIVAVLTATSDAPARAPRWLRGSEAAPVTPRSPPSATVPAVGAVPAVTPATAVAQASMPHGDGGDDKPAPPDEGPWRRVLPLGTDAPSELADVAVVSMGDRPVVLAAGGHADRPIVVVTTDRGATWRVLTQAGLPDGAAARAVTGDGQHIVLVLARHNGSEVWELRQDRWTAVPLEGSDGRVALSSVAMSSGTLVAAGYDPAGPGLWVRKDGEHLLRRVRTKAGGGVSSNTSVVFDVAAADGFTAAGRSGENAMLWSSRDGISWTAAALPGTGSAAATAVTPAGHTAAGYDGTGAAVWGVAGREVSIDRPPTPSDYPQAISALAVDGPVVVATGREGAHERCWWRPGGGLHFGACPAGLFSQPGTSVRALTVADDRIYAVGSIGGATPVADIWLLDLQIH